MSSLRFGPRPQEATWGNAAAMLIGATWEQIDRDGQAVRALWADFARGAAMPTTTIPGVVTVHGA